MKYPQLVSTRAVNAISDWLVARLEQLGVEAPHIYTRLLLSLLQSTVQLNDPIEFSNLESFLASRKGSGRRYRECDIDELKKYNAVQCIKNIVSSDQEIASIENLVEELFERLKDIEKQSSDSEDDDRGPVATLSITHRYNRSQQRRDVPTNSKSCRASCAAESSRYAEAAGTSASAKRLQEREREYWRAFPALSKQMGDIAPRWRHPSKWMLWPSDKPKDDAKKNASTSSASSTMSSNSDAEDGNQVAARHANEQRNIKEEEEDAMMEDTVENTEGATNVSGVELCDDIVDENDEIDDDEASCSANAAGYGSGAIKRNSKRRRSRGRSLSRKNPAGGNNSDSNNAGNNRSQASGGKNKRNLSPSCWDTDFEGCWEMGRDLIKEFIASQNRNARNRSTSESAVSYNKQSATEVAPANDGADDNFEAATNAKQQQPIEERLVENKDTAEDEKINANKAAVTPTLPPVDMSFCDYDDFDDTLASVSELTNDGPLAMLATSEGVCAVPSSTNAKRLYERELLPKDRKSDVQSDFAQFEAKFNSSVEALWKDADRSEEKGFSPFGDGNKLNIFNFGNGNSKHFSGPTSLPTDAPFSRNLKNFWSNYYNHHFDLSKMLPTSVIGEKAKELDVLMQNKANDKGEAAFKSNGADFSEANNFSNTQQGGAANTAGGPTSDYYSMPSNLEDIEKAKSQRSGLRHNSGCSDSGNSLSAHRAGGTIGEERKTPVALFLQNSIWSENANFGGGDSDETFYFKVHNSGNQLNAYDDNNREETLQCDATTSAVNTNNSSGFAFTAPYSASKWSEGINAGPPQGNVPTPLLQHKQQCGNQNNSYHLALNSTDCTDSSSSSACTPGASNWHHLPKSDAKNDWSAEQMRDTNAAHDTGSTAAPKITLANHSTTSSGFVAYSRIKAVLKLQLSIDGNAMNDAKQQQRNYPPRTNSKEQQQRYALDMMDDDESLLTSERTHFYPIKSYMDGHIFDICSKLDVIEYERSASGYLYYEEEKYLEYTRTDNFMVEDDGGIGASANPLYANSNCEAATASAKANSASHSSKLKRVERDFVIKFRMQRTEIACQTDPEPPTARALVSANKRNVVMNASAATKTAQPHPISLIFSNAAKNLKANAANELVYSDTVEAFTRAMAHFPPPQASSSNHSAWWSMGSDVGDCRAASSNWNVYQAQPKLQQNAKNNNNDEDDAYDDAGCDVVHFYDSINELPDGMAALHADVDMTSLEQQWSMNEIRKKCKEAGHMAAVDAVDGGAIESVWGMCAACNNELKSIPANRLLRDELQVEADQIMSDLKYMQDLYIGRAGDAADADDDDDDNNNNNAENGDDDHQCDGESAAETVTSDSDWCAEDITADVADGCVVNTSSQNANNNNELNEDHTMQQADSPNYTSNTVEGAANNSNDSETFTVIQKVNRLIAELLRPDNNADGVKQMDKQNANAACAKVNESRQMEAEATQFSGNLWHTNSNERNIWQLNAGDNTNSLIVAGGGGVLSRGDSVSGGGGVGGAMHPIQLLRQFNVKPLETAVANVDNVFPSAAAADVDKYHRQMSWEHENLARIWQTSPPSPPQTQTATMTINDAKPQATTEQKIVDTYKQQADIAEKNMRNLRANADASLEMAGANLQLAQDFKKHKESKVAAALANAQLVDSALKFKAITRKRRHSASQNYFHAHLNSSATAAVAAVNSLVGGGVTPLQNNNNEIANLNSYTLKSLRNSRNANELSLQNFLNASLRFGAAAAVAVAASNAKKCSDLANNLCGADFAFGCDSTATAAGRNQTIITCKYHLTAIEPLGLQQQNHDGDNNDYGLYTGSGIDGEGNTAAPLSSILDKNPSILKHVTMVSRPLTR